MKPQNSKAYATGQANRLVVLDAITKIKTVPMVAVKTGLSKTGVQNHVAALLRDGLIREAGKKTERRLVDYSVMTYELTTAPITASGQAAQRLNYCFFGVSV